MYMPRNSRAYKEFIHREWMSEYPILADTALVGLSPPDARVPCVDLPGWTHESVRETEGSLLTCARFVSQVHRST